MIISNTEEEETNQVFHQSQASPKMSFITARNTFRVKQIAIACALCLQQAFPGTLNPRAPRGKHGGDLDFRVSQLKGLGCEALGHLTPGLHLFTLAAALRPCDPLTRGVARDSHSMLAVI